MIGINGKSPGLDSGPHEIDPHRGLIVVTFSPVKMLMMTSRLEEWLEKFLRAKSHKGD